MLSKRRKNIDQSFRMIISSSGSDVNWGDITIKDLHMHSDVQRAFAGSLSHRISESDPTVLEMVWHASDQYYYGAHRIVGTIELSGAVARFDIPALEVVATSAEADPSTDPITLEGDINLEDLEATVVLAGPGPRGPKGDTGATGPQGPAGSDASVTSENIEAALGYTPADAAALASKLAWCGLESDGSIITREGETTALTFTQVKALVDDPALFVALKFGDIFWLLPQYDDLGGAIVFTGVSLLSEQGDLWRIAINSENRVSQYSIALENQYLKTGDMSKETIGSFSTYPTTAAVNGELTALSAQVTNLQTKDAEQDGRLTTLEQRPIVDKDLTERVADLENDRKYDHDLANTRIKSLSVDEPIRVCDAPMVLIGSGAPSATNVPKNWDKETMGEWFGIPNFVGQMYVNISASSNALYVAVNDTAVSGWKTA